jgi:hypothetical protein
MVPKLKVDSCEIAQAARWVNPQRNKGIVMEVQFVEPFRHDISAGSLHANQFTGFTLDWIDGFVLRCKT